MADASTVNIPTPPENADLNQLRKWATDLVLFLNQSMAGGLQTTFLSSNQLSNVSGNENAGKIFYNHEDGTAHMTVVSSGTLAVKQITLT